MEQGTNEWYKARLGKATGSKFYDIVNKTAKGKNTAKYDDYVVQLAIERITGEMCEQYTSRAMKNGKEYEPEARSLYEIEACEFVSEVGFVEHETMMCGVSPDGLIGVNGGIELKCPEKRAHFEYLEQRKVPDIYLPQVMGNIWINEREWFDFVSYNKSFPDPFKIMIVRVYRDDEYIKNLESEIKKFLSEVDERVYKLTEMYKD